VYRQPASTLAGRRRSSFFVVSSNSTSFPGSLLSVIVLPTQPRSQALLSVLVLPTQPRSQALLSVLVPTSYPGPHPLRLKLKLYVTKRNVLLGLPSLLTSPIQESPDTPRFSQVSILSHSAVSKPLNPGISDSTESSEGGVESRFLQLHFR
jgi:hypothetical protein